MTLLTLIRHAYRRLMPDKPDPFDITPAELEAITDQSVADHTGQPVDHGSLQLNIEAMQKRVDYHQGNIRRLSASLLADSNPDRCATMISEERRCLNDCRVLLESFQRQLTQQN